MKKWTFLVATLLTVSAGSLMTSCIDNDEPAGIEAIRVATANLLEAKKAVLLAQAEAAKVEAENAKILAAAEAKIKEAEAKVAEAEAQIKAAEAAGKQAEADKIKAETEAYIAQAKAELEAQIAMNELNIKNAQIAYDKAVYEFEQLKKLNADKLDNQLFQAVVAAYNEYINQLAAYNAANAAYLKAQRALAEYELDLEWNGTSFDSPNWDMKALLEKNVADAQADIDNINKSNAEFEEAIAKLKDIEGGELYTMMTEYQAKLKENEAAQEQVKIAQSKLHYENEALYDSVPDLQEQIKNLKKQEIEIAAYTYPGNTAIPGFEEEFEVVGEGKKFSLNNLDEYDAAVNAYKYNIEQIKAQLSTPNGTAWTEADLAELKRAQEATTKAYEKAQAAWDLATTIYHKGDKPNITSANMPQVAEIDAAVAALNTVGAKIQTSKDAVVTAHNAAVSAQDAFNAADKLYNEGDPDKKVAATNAKTTYDNAVAAAKKAYNDAVKENNKATEAAQAAVDQLAESQALAEQAAQNRVNSAERQFKLAQETALANPTAANIAAQTAAQTAWNKAIEAQTKLVADNATAMQKAQDAVNKAQENAALLNLAAENAKLNAIDAANLAFMTAGGNIADGSYNQEADPAYKPVAEAQAAKTKADKAYSDAVKALNKLVADATKKEVKAVTDNLTKQETTLGVAYTLTAWNKYKDVTFVKYTTVPATDADKDTWKKFADDKFKDQKAADFSPFMEHKLIDGKDVYVNAKAYVGQTSTVLYGSNVDADRLEPLTVDEMNAIIAANNPDAKPYEYYKFYAQFGAFGAVEANKATVAAIEATINNADAINEAVAGLEAALKALEESKAAQETAVKGVEDELKAVQDKIDALEGNLTRELATLKHAAGDLNTIIGTISTAILTLNDLNGAGNAADVIADAIETLEDQIKANETPLKDAEARLAKAQFQLKQYENGYTDLENPLKLAVESAKAELDLQQAKLEFCKSRLEAAQAKYEANAKA